ncbi:MAG: nucleoside hydrolase [Candidatus Rokubacteria bacterium]|nr:nucleoside hydrolase [Candidatus Rokubacteria bacterium]MBI3107306.1 nucleoside hydrolase [Candidatus Rokubacteria bacterium]
MTVPLLIDTDPGIDDALALLLALASPEVSVEAISTVAGNVPVEVATANVLRILEVVRPARLPRVARGAAAPLVRPLVTASHVHGEDGLGNIQRLLEPDGGPRYPAPGASLEGLDGADLILETAGRFSGRLQLVTLGPLTNLALALRRDRRRLAGVARVVIMGGAVAVPGNVTPGAEFNFFVDPEAAAAVFQAGLPLEVVPLDVTRQGALRRADLDARLPQPRSRVGRFLLDFTAHGFDFAAARGEDGIVLHDPLAVAVALDPSLVGFEALHVEVECEGRVTRGLSLADRRPIHPGSRRPTNCRVALAVDAPRVLALLLERLCRASA